MTLTLEDLAGDASTDSFDRWPRDGVLVLPGLIPDDAVDAYSARFRRDAVDRSHSLAELDREITKGYGIGTPYLQVPELRDVALHRHLVPHLTALVGDRAGLHLNLTGWRSTTRQFHQDQYLNPPCVGDGYVAAWIALDDIHSFAGPFEYVPGSHQWPQIDQAKMLEAMCEDGSDPDWPWHSEDILGPLFARELVNRGGHVQRFIAHKGDVLLWHPYLCHRGSMPADPTMERRALICHYSAIGRRCDMVGTDRRWTSAHADGWFFELGPVT